MTRFYLLVFALILIHIPVSYGQETVSVGAGYAEDRFYSLANGEVGMATGSDWDLAFQISGFAAGIRINAAKGITLKKVPNTDASGWATLDTTGYHSWSMLYNSDIAWENGAFNLGAEPGNEFDLGWGVYNPINHHVVGDSLSIITLTDGSMKKIRIDQLVAGVYTFTHADLDGSNEVTATVDKADFPNKFFGYYSVTGDSIIQQEPDLNTWDLKFTKYMGLLAPGFYYPVAGVLTNTGVEVAEMHPVDVAAVGIEDTAGMTFSTDISTIGYDWKSYDMNNSQWVLEDSLTYFVKALDGEIYQLTFTGFGGSAMGDFEFRKTNLTTSIDPLAGAIAAFEVFPNPAGNLVNLIFEVETSESVRASLVDLTGKRVIQIPEFRANGLQQLQLNLTEIPAGAYFVRLETATGLAMKKLIVR